MYKRQVENLVPVTTKQVEDLTAENEEEIGNDPVSILKGDIWIANGYLNLIFEQNRPVYGPHRVSPVSYTHLDVYKRQQLFPDRCSEIIEYLVSFCGSGIQLFFNFQIFFRMFILEAEVLQFCFYLIQSQAIGQRGIDVKRFSCNFILLVGQHGTCLLYTSRCV